MSSFLQSNAHFKAIGATLLNWNPDLDPKALQRILQAGQRLNALTVALQYNDPKPVYRKLGDITKGRVLGSDAALFKALKGLRYQIEEFWIERDREKDGVLWHKGRTMTAKEKEFMKVLGYWQGEYANKVAIKYMDMDTHAALCWAID